MALVPGPWPRRTRVDTFPKSHRTPAPPAPPALPGKRGARADGSLQPTIPMAPLTTSRPPVRSAVRATGLALGFLLLPLLTPGLPGASAELHAQLRGMEAADSYRVVAVGSVEMSPTGAHVAFTATEILEKDNARRTTIWIQELDAGRPVGAPIRFSDPSRNSSSPAWSPDGRLLSFSSSRDDGEEGTTWFLRVGGPGGEAFRIEGVRATPIWSPDGGTIAMLAPRAGVEELERQARRIAPDAITTGLDPRRFDGHVVTQRRYKSDGTFQWLPHPDHQPKDQLHLVPASGGEARPITDLPLTVRQAGWAPDGRWLVFSVDDAEPEEGSLDPSTSIHAIGADGTGLRRIVELEGGQSAPAVSPDGRLVAFLHTPSWDAETEIAVVEVGPGGVARGEPRVLTADWDRTPGAPEWTPDGRAIRWTSLSDANTHVFEVEVAGGPVRQVTTGDRTLGSVSVTADGRFMAYTSEDPAAPAEVFVADASGAGERRISGFNDAWREEVALEPARRIEWQVADGTRVEGWVIPPVGHLAGERRPLVLNIHGGPHSAYRNAFSPMFHVLSAAGFYVFYVNPRGSTGYGNDFKHAIHAGWGLIDEEDFVTGIEAVLAAYPDVDPARLGVTGGSYGGYMTNWLTARTDLFAAAVTRASISNWESLAKTTDSTLPHRAFDGASFEQREAYRAMSPISYVENVRAPTLVIHGEHDFRTPLGEGEQWYQALKKLGVPAEFVLYPRSGHGIREPWLAADNMERTRQWFAHWLGSGTAVADGAGDGG
jgi:dipeptidyl aminopeptidase/acylaminoacyl peptidase